MKIRKLKLLIGLRVDCGVFEHQRQAQERVSHLDGLQRDGACDDFRKRLAGFIRNQNTDVGNAVNRLYFLDCLLNIGRKQRQVFQMIHIR